MKRLLPFALICLFISSLVPAGATYGSDRWLVFLKLNPQDLDGFVDRLEKRLHKVDRTCDVGLAYLSPYDIQIGYNPGQITGREVLRLVKSCQKSIRILKMEGRMVPRGTPEPTLIEDGEYGILNLLTRTGAHFRFKSKDGKAFIERNIANSSMEDAQKLFGVPEQTGDNIVTFELQPANGFARTYFLDTKYANGLLISYRLRMYRSGRDYDWIVASD